MKIHKHTVIIIFSLFLAIEGMNITVQEGETVVFHLPNVESDTSDISSVEWTQMDRNKLLAYISLDNVNNTVIFQRGSRLQATQNGSIVIRDVQQEDSGNYTSKIIFKDGKIQMYIISLMLNSGNSEQIPTYNSTSTTPVPQARPVLQIVIPALAGLLLLGGVMTLILKCRRPRRAPDEPIYSNTIQKRKGKPRPHQKTGRTRPGAN